MNVQVKTDDSEKPETTLPVPWLILIALLQGVMLCLLEQALDHSVWPSQAPEWLVGFYTMVFIGPTMLLLGLSREQWQRISFMTLGFMLLTGVVGFYAGSQLLPLKFVGYDELPVAYYLTMGIVSFKVLMYIQQYSEDSKLHYQRLFLYSWRNALTLGLALAFAGCFWLILILWAELFQVIDIDFFEDLFKEPWFYYPVISIAFGFGVIIFRRLSNIIDTITRLKQALMRYLLVILVFVSILFLGGLAWTGLEPLWANGGSHLILWMMAFLLFLVNAVYQNETDKAGYPVWVHRFIYLGLVLLPAYSAISFYGLYARIEQYDWSLMRCWGFLVWGFLTFLSVGYLFGILRKRDQWAQSLSGTNIALSMVMIAVLLLVNSPILDFRQIVVSQQLAKLEANQVSYEDFDYGYFRYNLGRSGYLALQTLQEETEEEFPEISSRISAYFQYSAHEDSKPNKELFLRGIEVLAGELPSELGDAIYHNEIEREWMFRNIRNHLVIPVDLNGDQEDEFLLVKEFQENVILELYFLENNQWKFKDVVSTGEDYENQSDVEAILSELKEEPLKVREPQWKELEINEVIYRIGR